MIILASTSPARQRMLTAAGVAHEAVAPNVDEDAAKAALAHLSARDLADELAELKAAKISRLRPNALVIGSDQVLELDDGTRLDKPGEGGVAAQLRRLSGRRHRLHAGVVAAESGMPVWRHVGTSTLWVRPLSESFIADYVGACGAEVAGSVGAYHVEGLGAQLFERIEGDPFTIQGLPLLPLLAWLRVRGVLQQ